MIYYKNYIYIFFIIILLFINYKKDNKIIKYIYILKNIIYFKIKKYVINVYLN